VEKWKVFQNEASVTVGNVLENGKLSEIQQPLNKNIENGSLSKIDNLQL